jgi:D-serine dehydratase
LTAGGSSYYDVVASILGTVTLSRPTSVVVRSGCYLTHDVGIYKDRLADILQRSSVAQNIHEPPRNALEVWCYVLSLPEKGRAILGAGRRDFGHDAGAPIPIKQFRPGGDKHPRELSTGGEIVAINDQHAHLKFSEENDYRVGDMIALGVSHPCTTFDKWRVLYLVNDAYTVTSAIETFF